MRPCRMMQECCLPSASLVRIAESGFPAKCVVRCRRGSSVHGSAHHSKYVMHCALERGGGDCATQMRREDCGRTPHRTAASSGSPAARLKASRSGAGSCCAWRACDDGRAANTAAWESNLMVACVQTEPIGARCQRNSSAFGMMWKPGAPCAKCRVMSLLFWCAMRSGETRGRSAFWLDVRSPDHVAPLFDIATQRDAEALR